MNKIITLLTAAAIVFDLFTPFRLYFEGGRAVAMLVPSLVILLSDFLVARKSFLTVALFILTCLILMVMGSEYFTIPELVGYLFAYACFEHFLLTKDQQYAKVVLVSLYATLMVTVAMSIPLFISMPNLSRLMIDAEENGITDSIMFWTIQYPTIHALPVYSIPLFYIAKTGKGKILRLLSLVSIIAVLVLMFYADATTALLLTLAIYAILLFYNTNKSFKENGVKLVLVGLALLFFLNKTVLIGILRASQFIFEGSSTYNKIDAMVFSLSGQGATGDIEGRQDMLNVSINSLLSNPLLPEMSIDKIGQHNYLIDIFVAMGLLLGITFIFFLLEG